MKNDEWFNIGNINNLEKYGIDGRWVSCVSISKKYD